VSNKAYQFNLTNGGVENVVIDTILWILGTEVRTTKQRKSIIITDTPLNVANTLKLISLTDYNTSSTIYVNPSKISDVVPTSTDGSLLKMPVEGFLRVTDSVSTVIGAMTSNVSTTFGYEAGYEVTTGVKNALFGEWAGYAITTGSRNQCFGFQAGAALTTEQNTTIVGRQAASITSA
jgi:hypothetical protein